MLEKYKPSGEMGGTAAIGMVVAAGAVGLVGAAYQAIIYFVPYVMLTWMATIFFAFGAQVVVKRVVKRWHCRNRTAGVAIGLVGAVVGVAVSHYVGFALVVKGLPPLTEMVEYLRFRVESGWMIGGSSSRSGGGSLVNGWGVYMVWGLEAAMVCAGGIAGGWVGAGLPYCESCGKWADKVRGKFEVQSPTPAEIDLVRCAEHVDDLVAEEGGGAPGTAIEYVVHECPGCAGVQTVNTKLRWVETARKGQVQVKRRTLHERIMLNAEDVEVVLGMAPGTVKA